jgi:hypothetical protein
VHAAHEPESANPDLKHVCSLSNVVALIIHECHPERSEGSRPEFTKRFFAALRMTNIEIHQVIFYKP